MYPAQPFSPPTTITADVNSTNTRIYVDDVQNLPTPPSLLSISPADGSVGETMKLVSIGSNFIDVIRDEEGIAQSWKTGAIIRRSIAALDMNTVQDNLIQLNTDMQNTQSTAVEGATLGGANVTKTNKTLSFPAYPTTLPASDVSAWAKQATKPVYTKNEIGLGNVDNTSDSNKPISITQQAALDAKVPLARTINNKNLSANIMLTPADIGLGNVTNTSDADKPVSLAQQTALDELEKLINAMLPFSFSDTIPANKWELKGGQYEVKMPNTKITTDMNMVIGLSGWASINNYIDMGIYYGITFDGGYILYAVNAPEAGTSINIFAEVREVY